MKPEKELTPFQKALLDSVLESFSDLPENDELDSSPFLDGLLERFIEKPKE